MSKSTIAIAGMGVLACALLSLLMKQAAGLQSEARRAPYLPALEAKFAARLAGPMTLREEATDGDKRIVVSMRLDDGADAKRVATAVAEEVWLHAARAGTDAKEVVAVVRGTEPPLRVAMARPRRSR